MAYAQIDNGTITKRSKDRPTRGWQETSIDPPEGTWVPILSDPDAASFGWFPVTRIDKPADTPTDTTDRTWVLAADVITETWTARPKTQAELDADQRRSDQAVALGKVADLEQFLAIPSPTGAQVATAVEIMAGVCRRLLLDSYGEG